MTIKLIHCADLHLSTREKDYSLGVFREIIEIANRESADFLLLAGDIFDSFAEIENLEADFKATVRLLDAGCEPFLLAGNHEELQRNAGRIASFDLGLPSANIIDTDKAPFRLIERTGLEILAIPHQRDYRGYTDWKAPEKKVRFRVAMAHAANEDLAFVGFFDEENKAGVIDTDLFQRFQVDYAALGHIHSAAEKTVGNVRIAYSGSARVWRKDETGPRCVTKVELGHAINLQSIPILSAGQFKRFVVNLNLNGKPETDLSTSIQVGDRDWVWLEFQGLVEDAMEAKSSMDALADTLRDQARRVDTQKDAVESCAGIAGQDIAKKFLELWEARKPAHVGDELEVWQRAREIGLRKIKSHIETRP